MHPHLLGRRSEDLACRYLESKGWQILERNYRAGHKEIDIIARLARTIAFVEVKARAGEGYGHPLTAITWRKRREIEHVARVWLERNRPAVDDYRFDAIAINWKRTSHVLEHVENAWRTEFR